MSAEELKHEVQKSLDRVHDRLPAMTTLDFFCDPELRERSTRAFREAAP